MAIPIAGLSGGGPLVRPPNQDFREYGEVEEGDQFATPEEQEQYDEIMEAIGNQILDEPFQETFDRMLTDPEMPPHQDIGTISALLMRRVIAAIRNADTMANDEVLAAAGQETVEILTDMAYEAGHLGVMNQDGEAYQEVMGKAFEYGLQLFGQIAAQEGELNQQQYQEAFREGLRSEGLDPDQVIGEIKASMKSPDQARSDFADRIEQGQEQIPPEGQAAMQQQMGAQPGGAPAGPAGPMPPPGPGPGLMGGPQ